MTAPAPPKSTAQVLQLLAAGQTVQRVGDTVGWPRRQLHRLINATPGWLLDPDRDTVYDPNTPGMRVRLPDGIDPSVPAAPPPPAAADLYSDTEHPLIALIERARDLHDPTVVKALAALNRAISRLRVRVEVAEKYRMGPNLLSGATGAGLDPRAVRAWAAQNGVSCGDLGPIPRTVLVAYVTAHQSREESSCPPPEENDHGDR